MSTTTIPTALAAKHEGQMLSLLDLLDDPAEAFMDLVTVIPVGTEFSVNRIRSKLDAHDVPNKARAGLFARACKAGLIEPVTVTVGAREVAVKEPSTGTSAHAAHVQVYRRVDSS